MQYRRPDRVYVLIEEIVMKKVILSAAFCGVLAMPAWAGDVEALAKEKECMSCHALDKDAIGPAFASIANKYKGNERSEAMLVSTVMKGSPSAGGYHWGTKKMPPSSVRQSVSADEAKALVDWILAM